MVANGLTTKVVTVPVTDGPQLNDQQFQGWYIHPGGSLEAINCGSGSSLLTTESYAECCALGATDCTTFFTKCDGTASAVGVSTAACSVCQTMSIYDQFPINADPYTQILCVPDSWPASSIFRTVITSTTTKSVFEYSDASPSATSSVAYSTGGASSSSGSTSSNDPSTSSSNAWIAGAIVGPVAALIILVAVVIWLLRRKKKQQRSASTAYPSTSQYGSPGAGPGGVMGYGNPSYGNQSYASQPYSDHGYESVAYKHQPYHHMAGGNERHELPVGARSHELPGGTMSPRSKPSELSDSN